MTSLKLCSYNVKGINEKKKRTDLFAWLRKKNCDIYLLQESHCTKSKETLWQNEWGYKAHFSSHTGNSRGVVTLINNTFQYDLHKTVTDTDGRYIILDCTISGQRFTIANIYGPNEDDPHFFDMLRTKIEQFENTSIILGGDFNVVQNYLLDTLNIKNRNNPNSHERVLNLKQELDLLDPWREENPETRIYTWHNNQNKQSRLDYFLISSDVKNCIEKTNIKPGYRSDHSLVEITMNLNNQPKGRGIWKFNNSLLKDNNYVREVKKCIQDTKDQYKTRNVNQLEEDPENYNICSQLLFETIKMEVRGKTIAYSTAKKKDQDSQESKLEDKIDELHKSYIETPTIDNLTKLNEAHNELKVLREKKIEGIIIRSKAKWHLEGERNSRYFCNLEKRHYQEKIIPKLIDNEDNQLTNMKDILNEQKRFYQNLYTSIDPQIDADSENTTRKMTFTYHLIKKRSQWKMI
jgi:exonuclease III